MATWSIRRLDAQHDRSAFDCGQVLLNDWLKNRAGQFDRRDLARTFVATRPDDVRVQGYRGISSHRVVHEALPETEAKGLPRLGIPVVLLGRLAVDRSAQGCGLGALLLVDALRRSANISAELGIRAVEVHALDDTARRFYLKFGFRPFLDDPRHLFLPIHEIRNLGFESPRCVLASPHCVLEEPH